MDKELEKYEKLYNMVIDYTAKNHEKNQKRIKTGLKCLYIIPAVFLFLLLVTGSSRIIFLVLWIISLFAIALYLIIVEYIDYNLQKRINELEGRKNAPLESLMETDRIDESLERLEETADKIEAVVGKVTTIAKEKLRPDELQHEKDGKESVQEDSNGKNI